MKKNQKEIAPENISNTNKDNAITKKKGVQKEANPEFPQEYEEQQNIDIRMKPQIFEKPKKK
ncbi:MAG: hypothetical protein H7321_10390 [Bacteroidia bacterium]|nr:hypothetical protein [Bacteroidia bacterium]